MEGNIDPNLNSRIYIYISKKATYTTVDWSNLNINNPEKTLCFLMTIKTQLIELR